MKAAKGGGMTPRWGGGRMPLSTTLADAMVEAFARAAAGVFDGPEMQAARPMLELQARWSALPTPRHRARRDAEDARGLASVRLSRSPAATSIWGWRASSPGAPARASAGTFSLSVNDYGFEVLSATERDWGADLPRLLAPAPTSPR